MRKTSRTLAGVAIAAASVGIAVAAAPTASAERGESGCFAYSYDDSGDLTTTVYYNNHCNSEQTLHINRDPNDVCGDTIDVKVGPDAKGNEVVRCGRVTGVWN
ncbi:hypothetical protein [Nocardia mexicana]|uniref:Alpha amylase inhibitor n=1 Tax=Nocardia mexicana TaxID=279262 RepID=A0A370GCW7_9NOCA|nr:hypothetical protein [Nocardia mexicana]RDI41537.1 hypothetical protein DFR68_1327 [Nocardia mexicana]